MSLRKMILLATALTLVFGVAACGKKGPLDPPPAHEKKEKPAP